MRVLMPKGVALWLLKHTKLHIDQIAQFCQLDFFSLNSLNEKNTVMFSPIETGQLTIEEIQRCETNPQLTLENKLNLSLKQTKSKRKYFTQFEKEQRPYCIAWLTHYYPELPPDKIARLLHTTQYSVERIQNQFKKNPSKFSFVDPSKFSFCTAKDIQDILDESN